MFVFNEAAADSGLSRSFGFENPDSSYTEQFGGGVAAADFDDDGDIDLYVVGGDTAPNALFENRGDGTFVEVAASVGLDITHRGSGPNFADIDGDGDLDFFVGATDGDAYGLYENRLGSYIEITVRSGLNITVPSTISSTFADYDKDGDLDLFLSHWGADKQPDTETLWKNDGRGNFESASIESGLAEDLIEPTQRDGIQVWIDRTFTPNLTDIDTNGTLDLLFAADFGSSQVYLNNGDGTFSLATDRDVIADEFGMGASVGDIDNDGDSDWFVTSIYENGVHYGNRLYRNDGQAVFVDVTDEAGVADGGWGWASCMADFDNDGHLDIAHANGWRGTTAQGPQTTVDGAAVGVRNYSNDPIRFFHSNGDGSFTTLNDTMGLEDRGQGRGMACFDADRDGDIDIVAINNDDTHILYYRNDSTFSNNFLGVHLRQSGRNSRAIGARVVVTTSSGSQSREVRSGSNFSSQDPPEAHFGLGSATSVDIEVVWPDGSSQLMNGVQANQWITIQRSG